LLGGCSAEPKPDRAVTEFSRIREALTAEASAFDVTASVSADYGERVFDFRLRYVGSPGGGEIEILAPESLAGVRATVAGNEATLKFDGAAIDTGALADGLSPAGIVPRLIVEWQAGFAESLRIARDGLDREELIMRSALTAETRHETRFALSTRAPVRTEVTEGERVILTVVYEAFSITA